MDAYKDLLVVLDTARTCASRIDVATGLARRFGAHLTGLYVSPAPQVVVPAMIESQFAPELMEIQMRSIGEATSRVQELFRRRADAPDLTTEWRTRDGEVGEVVTRHARHVDLAIVGQVDPEAPDALGAAGDLPERIVLGSGRPALVVPYAGTFTTVGQRVLVAWNGGREATRAVNDALPLLAGATKVTVLTINPRGGQDLTAVPGADIALHLARHGVNAEAATIKSDHVEVGALLLSYAADLGADLLVMGAYGHSRLREVVLGGATREILAAMTVPVLLSH